MNGDSWPFEGTKCDKHGFQPGRFGCPECAEPSDLTKLAQILEDRAKVLLSKPKSDVREALVFEWREMAAALRIVDEGRRISGSR